MQATLFPGVPSSQPAFHGRRYTSIVVNRAINFVANKLSDADLNAGSCLIFPQILQTLQSYFSGICHQSDFAKSSQKEGVKSQLQSLLEAFRGAALATNLRNVHALFHCLNPVLRDCVHLLSVYQNCPEMVVVVLEFCFDLADSQIPFLSKVSCGIRIHRISLIL